MERKYFGTDGIRSRVGSGYFTPEFVLKLGWAAGTILGGNGSKILIGKDTRVSGYMFEAALEAGLVAAGVNVRLLGPMPTPGIAYLTRTLHAQAGIVISASHNPYHDNGIKFFSSLGDKLPDEVELRIEAAMTTPMSTVDSKQLGKVKRIDDAAGRYIEFCKSTLPNATSLKGMKIVVDCAHGATYHIAPNVLEELDADVIAIGCQPDGFNINSKVGATNPEVLAATVLQHQADLGIALDGDGDRLILVNRQGQVIDGDGILYIIARSRQASGNLHGPVVGTVMSNMGLEKALSYQDIGFERTKVGDRYVLEQMKVLGATLGGEPSGHIICRDRLGTGDGIITALQVLSEMVTTGLDLDMLLQDLAIYPQRLVNIPLPRKVDVLTIPAVQAAVNTAKIQLDGHGRILIRPSGTEPLVRIMVEGQAPEQVEIVTQMLADVVQKNLNQLATNL
ncbi:phosphoglucosamine mutase [Achromatium sp. WMS2]|nr:phosphoglucosamine mutase [Achromatium sp. WMS2]